MGKRLTKGQKARKWGLVAEARSATTQSQAERLWNWPEARFADQIRMTLLGNADVWQWVKPLYSEHGRISAYDDYEFLLENSALTDQELATFQVAYYMPLKVLEHQNCGDESLKIVAELWEDGERDSIRCVPGWASTAQIARMHELRPSCVRKNATVEFAAFCSQTLSDQVKLFR